MATLEVGQLCEEGFCHTLVVWGSGTVSCQWYEMGNCLVLVVWGRCQKLDTTGFFFVWYFDFYINLKELVVDYKIFKKCFCLWNSACSGIQELQSTVVLYTKMSYNYVISWNKEKSAFCALRITNIAGPLMCSVVEGIVNVHIHVPLSCLKVIADI